MKRCSTCKETKELTEFPKDKRSSSGVKSECKYCHKERNKRLYHANKERYAEVKREYIRNNPSYRRSQKHRKKARIRNLTNNWTKADLESVKRHFNHRCPLTGSEDIHFDHFIPLSIGHGGSYVGNMIPLDGVLNASKCASNPFEWIKTRNDIEVNKFNKVVEYLAELNGLTPNEFRSFVYWCFENKRSIDEIKSDTRSSIEIWRSKRSA